MSNRRRRREQAQRTTPATARFVEVDDSRTFLVFGVFTESMVSLGAGRAPEPAVRADLTGKWNHGAEDKPVLLLQPDLAREWAQTLLTAADAAERDVRTWLAGRHPSDGSPR